MMPTKLTIMPTRTMMSRPPVLDIIPTLDTAISQPTSVTTSPTNAIGTSLRYSCPFEHRRYLSPCTPRLGLLERRDRYAEREEALRSDRFFLKKKPARLCQRCARETPPSRL